MAGLRPLTDAPRGADLDDREAPSSVDVNRGLGGDQDVRLRWPENPKLVHEGDAVDLSLVLENDGKDAVEFDDAFLVLFVRLVDDEGREVTTPGRHMDRELPRIHYRFEPGDARDVRVAVSLSPDDERAFWVGHYTVVIPLGDERDKFANSVLASARVDPPTPLTVEVRSGQPH